MRYCKFLFIIYLVCSSNSAISQALPNSISYAYYEDTKGDQTLEEVKQKEFTDIDFKELSFGLSNTAYWVEIKAIVDKDKDWILQSCYTQIDTLDVFIEDGNKLRTIQTGDSKVFSSRDVRHPCFVFKLPGIEQQSIYIRAASQGTLNIPARIIESDEFWENNTKSQLLYGLLYAVLLLILIHNLFQYLLFKQRVHLYYLGYYTGILIFLSSMSGHSFMYLWPNNAFLASNAVLFSIGMAIGCGAQFIKYFCYSDGSFPKVRLLFNVISVIAFSLAFLQINYYKLSLILLMSLLAILLVVTFFSLWITTKTNSVAANIAFYGYLLIFPGFVFLLLSTIGAIEYSLLFRHLMHAGLVAKGLALSMATGLILKDTYSRLDQQREQNILIKSQFAQNTIKEIDKVKHTLAREIHDGLGQNLLAISSQLQILNPSKLKDDILNNIKFSLNEIRNLARQIHPQELETLGLKIALKAMFDRTLLPHKIEIEYEIEDITYMLDKDIELQIYRIAQESLNNIVKHANAKKVKLNLSNKPTSVLMTIENDGNSFNSIRNAGMGIQNMTERSAMINADFNINHSKTGTTITVDTPHAS